MVLTGDRVPMYKMRANRGLLSIALFVFVVGGLIAVYFFNEDGCFSGCPSGVLALVVTFILVVCLIIAATSHFWFRHLWHHRPGYKRG